MEEFEIKVLLTTDGLLTPGKHYAVVEYSVFRPKDNKFGDLSNNLSIKIAQQLAPLIKNICNELKNDLKEE